MPVNKTYTVISLDDLETVRQQAKQYCALKEKMDGGEYKLRTFYLGPRDKAPIRGLHRNSRPASTPRRNAIAAKIGIYKVQGYYNDANHYGGTRRRPYMELQGYV